MMTIPHPTLVSRIPSAASICTRSRQGRLKFQRFRESIVSGDVLAGPGSVTARFCDCDTKKK